MSRTYRMKNKHERSAKKQRVMEAIARKQDEQLTNASLEELQAIMDAL